MISPFADEGGSQLTIALPSLECTTAKVGADGTVTEAEVKTFATAKYLALKSNFVQR